MSDNYTSEQIVGFMKKNWPEMYGPAHEFIVYLYRVRDLSFARARATLARFDLSVGEFDILSTLRRSASPHVLMPTELQRSLLITSGGLTKLLYQLESRGLVSRSVWQRDKRCKRVHLTPKGKETAESAMAAAQETAKEWLGEAFPQRELDQPRRLLRKAARVLEKQAAAGDLAGHRSDMKEMTGNE